MWNFNNELRIIVLSLTHTRSSSFCHCFLNLRKIFLLTLHLHGSVCILGLRIYIPQTFCTFVINFVIFVLFFFSRHAIADIRFSCCCIFYCIALLPLRVKCAIVLNVSAHDCGYILIYTLLEVNIIRKSYIWRNKVQLIKNSVRA